jgi:hypothetical protein
LHLTHQLARRLERWNAGHRAQRASLRSPKAFDRHLTGRAVHPLVGNIADPSVEVSLQCRPALEVSPGDRVLLHIANAALVLAFGARSIRRAGPRPKIPMLGKGVQSGIELDLAGGPVVARDQPAIIVEQHLFGDPAEMTKCPLDTGKPTLLALVAERPHIEPPRVAQRRHKQVHLDVLTTDRHPALAKIDLQLLARRCLKSDRRSRFRLQGAPKVRYLPLDRPQAQPDPFLALELLANYIGIASMTAKTLRYPILKAR